MTKWMQRGLVLTGFSLVLACNRQQSTDSGTLDDAPPRDFYLLANEPNGAQDVIEIRQKAQDQEAVVVVGRIGGSENPWVENRAAFAIVDLSLKACSDIEGDECPTPWDYCCETDRLAQATVLVKLIDDSGKLLRVDARKMLGIKELQTVIVQGKAQRDDVGNVTLLASSLYVKP